MPQALIDEPQPIAAAEHILGYFYELQSARTLQAIGMGGVYYPPLSYQEIAAWKALRGLDLEWWEVSLIKSLDAVYVEYMNDALKKKKDKPAMQK